MKGADCTRRIGGDIGKMPGMQILALDTSTEWLSVAVHDGRTVVALFTAIYRSERERRPIAFPVAAEVEECTRFRMTARPRHAPPFMRFRHVDRRLRVR